MLTKPQESKLIAFIKERGNYALKALETSIDIQYKDDKFDIVTKIDKELEQKFFDYLTKNFPDYGFFGEEFENLRSQKDYVWFLDPIDGTKYYARGVSLWAVSIALSFKDEIIWSAVYSPATQEFYLANFEGSFINNKKISIANPLSIQETQVFLYLKSYKNSGDTINKITEQTSRLRIFGIDSLSLCWIAQGFPAVFVKIYEKADTKHLVDFSGGGFIAKQAGAKIEKLDYDAMNFLLMVGNPEVVDKIGRILVDKYSN